MRDDPESFWIMFTCGFIFAWHSFILQLCIQSLFTFLTASQLFWNWSFKYLLFLETINAPKKHYHIQNVLHRLSLSSDGHSIMPEADTHCYSFLLSHLHLFPFALAPCQIQSASPLWCSERNFTAAVSLLCTHMQGPKCKKYKHTYMIRLKLMFIDTYAN